MLVDMKLTPEMKKEDAQSSVLYDTPDYPYGLKIQLDPETYAKLGMKEAPQIGQKMMMLAMIQVCGGCEESSKGDAKGYSATLQIMQMELKPAEDQKSVESVLYKD